MATQAGTPATPQLSPQVICNAFVQQYYHILHETPDQVHKFYQDTSSLGRVGSDGVMEYVTTLPEINRKIMSMDVSNSLTEIETADTLLSHKDGVLIVVTGRLTMSDRVCHRFTQSFFLAPQESGGYFVLNDMLRFISERPPENDSNHNDGSVAESDPTPAAVAERLPTDQVVVENNGTTVENNPTVTGTTVENNNPTVNGTTVENNPTVTGTTIENNNPTVDGTTVENNTAVNGTTVEKKVTVEPPVKVTKEVPKKTPVAASPPPSVQKDVTKKSYASIVKVMKEGPPTPFVKPKPVPKPVTKAVTKAVEDPDKSSVKPSQATETSPADMNVGKRNTPHDEQGYSVFVKSLPFNSTVQMVEEEFKKFGTIKPGGIQVRNNKIDQFCFGFVEFESQQSMQAAIEASPIFIGEKEVRIEEKRTTTRVVNGVVVTNAGGGGGGGRFQSGRGTYRGGDNYRGRGGGYVNNANFNRWNDGDNFNRRNDGDSINRRNDGDNFNRRNDGDNFNRRNDIRNRNEFSGRGRGLLQGNGYHHNGSFHQPQPFQNENGRFARVNGPKQTPVAA